MQIKEGLEKPPEGGGKSFWLCASGGVSRDRGTGTKGGNLNKGQKKNRGECGRFVKTGRISSSAGVHILSGRNDKRENKQPREETAWLNEERESPEKKSGTSAQSSLRCYSKGKKGQRQIGGLEIARRERGICSKTVKKADLLDGRNVIGWVDVKRGFQETSMQMGMKRKRRRGADCNFIGSGLAHRL